MVYSCETVSVSKPASDFETIRVWPGDFRNRRGDLERGLAKPVEFDL